LLTTAILPHLVTLCHRVAVADAAHRHWSNGLAHWESSLGFLR
jgi:hypothetical protein